MLEQVAVRENATVAHTIRKVCTLLPDSEVQATCALFIDMYAPVIIDL